MLNFIPDGGKYEIVSFICPCVGRVYTNVPMHRVATEVVGWTHDDAYGPTEGLLPLVPVVLDLNGLRACPLVGKDERCGAPRLAKIDQCVMTHSELIALHRGYHAQD